MACRIVNIPGYGLAIVCGPRGRRRANCEFCSNEHTKLCDFPVSDGGTCDKKLCDEHGLHVGPNRDYCYTHPRNLELAI